MPAECLARPPVELVCYSIKLVLSNPSQAMSLGEVLAEQSVGVLIAAPLPWTAWVAEIDRQAGVDGEADVASHLRALVPGQRAAQAGGKRHDCFGEGLADPFGSKAVGSVKSIA